ncbi:MAG: hypothetical protein ABW352_14490 [Polyangiales bacterium]
MSTKTRIYQQADLAAALAREEPDMPLPGLVDLRHKGPLLEQTQVLDAATLQQLRADYAALRGAQPIVSEARDGELTDRTTRALGLKPRRFRLIGSLLAVLVALCSYSLCRSWFAGKQVARAATQAPVQPSAPTVVAEPIARERPTQPPAPNLPRMALDALASGDRERAHRMYEQLARHEPEPGPYELAASILARELRAGE